MQKEDDMKKKYIVRQLVETGYAVGATYAIGRWGIAYAYMERGYEAVGGEYALILGTYLVAHTVISYLFKALEEQRDAKREKLCSKRRCGRIVGMRNYRRAIRTSIRVCNKKAGIYCQNRS